MQGFGLLKVFHMHLVHSLLEETKKKKKEYFWLLDPSEDPVLAASWGNLCPFIILVMACWVNLPEDKRFSSELLLVSLWDGRWHHSDFFDVPVSSSFHYLGRTWSRAEMESMSHPRVPAVFPLLCLCRHLLPMSPSLSRSWGHGDRWPGPPLLLGPHGFGSLSQAKPEHFSQQSQGQGLTWGQAPEHSAQTHKPGWEQGDDGLSCAGRSLLVGCNSLSPSSVALPFWNLWASFRVRAWGPSCSEMSPWSQVV